MDVLDVFGFGNLAPSTRNSIRGLQGLVPVPGDSDTGGIVGAIIDTVGGIIGGRSPGLPTFPPPPTGLRPQLQQGSTPGVQGGAFPAARVAGDCPTDACCKGQHLNKSRTCDGLPAGSKCVSNRRMNALNPQALRRAIRRAKSFERFVKSNRKSLRSLAKI